MNIGYTVHQLLRYIILTIFAFASSARLLAYSVEINAPKEVKPLLEQYLQINQANKQTEDEELFQYRVEMVPTEVNNLLATQGYFSSQTQIQRDEKNTVKILVNPGPKTRVGSFQLELKGTIKDDPAFFQYQKELQRKWPLRPGRVFTQELWDEGKVTGLLILSREKYARARILASEAKIIPNERTADLSIEYDSGPIYRIGEIQIKGLSRYPEAIIRHQILTRPGEDYSREKLLDIQSILQNFPHFVSAIVEPDFSQEKTIDNKHMMVPILVTVQEAPLQKLNLGVGYSTDREMRGEIQYQYNNIAGKGWILAVTGKIDKLEKQGSIILTVPKRGKGYDDSFYSTYTTSNIENLRTIQRSIGAQRIRNRGLIETAWIVDYTDESLRFKDGSTETPRTLGLSYKWIRRDLDEISNPRSGNMLWLEGGGAVKGIGADTSFFNIYGTGVVYWKMGKRSILISRLEAGQVFGNNTLAIPSRWLFRAGGSNSVRGYRYNSLGVSRRGSIVHGRVLGTGTLEFQHSVYKGWRAAVFVDGGDAAQSWKTYQLHTGAGVGARWASPVGVFGADLAYGFQDKKWHFYVSMGLMF